MNEFNLIEKYFNWTKLDSTTLGIGDDCALISIQSKQQLAMSVDTLIEGVHFPINTSPADIAHKALSVNLSDLAAMGATPKFFTLALTLPEYNQVWLEEFSTSLKTLANRYKIDLIGGDTTKGRLSITINVTGVIDKNKAILRSGAQVGDYIFVSNTLGDAALAWRQLQQNKKPSENLLQQFNRPQPQVELGRALINIANSCIDISDGLEQDLSHILDSSNVGARINMSDLPLSDELTTYIENSYDWCLPLSGGDDYELCFTTNQENVRKVEMLEKRLNIRLTAIGVITKELGLERLGMFDEECSSYQHF